MCRLIQKYFPSLTPVQIEQFGKMTELYPEWNDRINVVSRKDIQNLETNHILHSLAIARFLNPVAGSSILDFGTGGGFPGIPLAVMFPHVRFHLIDRIGKKINVARAVAEDLGLTNVTFQHGDIGECREKFDFVVSRAVMPQPDLVKLARKNISPVQRNAIPNGLIALKGGDLQAELKDLKSKTETVGIENYFHEPYFDTKKIVYTVI